MLAMSSAGWITGRFRDRGKDLVVRCGCLQNARVKPSVEMPNGMPWNGTTNVDMFRHPSPTERQRHSLTLHRSEPLRNRSKICRVEKTTSPQ
jgi:hypothetical protein